MWKKHYLIIDYKGNIKEVNLNTRMMTDIFLKDDLGIKVKEHENKKQLIDNIEKFIDDNVKFNK